MRTRERVIECLRVRRGAAGALAGEGAAGGGDCGGEAVLQGGGVELGGGGGCGGCGCGRGG